VAALAEPQALRAQDDKNARAELSCRNGNAKDCFEVAKLYRDGKNGVQRDGPKASELYLLACREGYWEACEQYGAILLAGSDLFRRDTIAGDSLVLLACAKDPERGSSGVLGIGAKKPRCESLIGLYKRRLGQRIGDSVTAYNLMTKACNSGFGDACTMKSRWQRDATFPKELPAPPPPPPVRQRAPVDTAHPATPPPPPPPPPPPVAEPVKALPEVVAPTISASRRAQIADQCDRQDATACLQAGDWFQSGVAGMRDLARARDLFQKGCDARNPTACYRAALMYRDGLGGAKDAQRANVDFKQACERGERRACAAGTTPRPTATLPPPPR
jgi:TPR repeat protein